MKLKIMRWVNSQSHSHILILDLAFACLFHLFNVQDVDFVTWFTERFSKFYQSGCLPSWRVFDCVTVWMGNLESRLLRKAQRTTIAKSARTKESSKIVDGRRLVIHKGATSSPLQRLSSSVGSWNVVVVNTVVRVTPVSARIRVTHHSIHHVSRHHLGRTRMVGVERILILIIIKCCKFVMKIIPLTPNPSCSISTACSPIRLATALAPLKLFKGSS